MTGPDKLAPDVGMLTTGQAARVLGFKFSRVRRWVSEGRLAHAQAGFGGWRMIPADELARFAARYGLSLNWAAL